jgi:hypothetical protein
MGPLAPTLEGQYILKNIVFVAAGWTILMPSLFASRRDETPQVTPIGSPGLNSNS